MNTPALDQKDAPQLQPGLSRHEYWKMVSEQARQAEGTIKAEDSPMPLEGAAAPESAASPEQPAAVEFAPSEAAPAAESPPQPPEGPPPPPPHPAKPRRPFRFPRLHFGSPLWTIASILSLAVNIILILVLVLLARQVFGIKNALQEQLVNGLYKNFALMDQARIKTTIPISTSVPAKFDLPLNTITTVVLQKEVLLKNARVVSLTTGGLTITNAPADIILPAGAQLPVSLSLTVPVDQQIPVNLNVEVDIPLNQTDLHAPFVGLQDVVSPYKQLLDSTPNTLQDAVCGQNGSDFCKWMIQ
jgi:hypothetical protein